MNPKANLLNWALLLGLVALWGTSFLIIAISVKTIDPISIVFYRLVLGALVLALVVFARGESIPRELRIWGGFLLMAIVGNALPFFLITWGQQSFRPGRVCRSARIRISVSRQSRICSRVKYSTGTTSATLRRYSQVQ